MLRSLNIRWLFALHMSLCCATGSVKAEVINVICSVHEWCDVVQRAFTASTGIEVNITELGSSNALDRIRAQKERPRHDLWFGGTGEFHLEAARLQLTLPYRSPNSNLLPEWDATYAKQSGFRTNDVYSGPLNFVYNAGVLRKAGAPAPRCWSDLIKPAYHNQIQIGRPGGIYSVIATLVQLKGEDEAFLYLHRLHSNIKDYSSSGPEALAKVVRGEAAIAIAFVYGANSEIFHDPDIRTITPCEGTSYEIGGMSIIKGGPNRDGAKRFYDWALTAQAQKLMGQKRQFAMSANAMRRLDGRIVDPPATRLINYDSTIFGTMEERNRLLKKWEETIADKRGQ